MVKDAIKRLRRVVEFNIISILGLTVLLVAVVFTFYSKYESRVLESQIKILEQDYKSDLKTVHNVKFQFVVSALDHSMTKALEVGTFQLHLIEEELLDLDDLAYWLNHIEDKGNPVIDIIGRHVKGVFLTREADFNDPFVLLTFFNGETVILVDFSVDCALDNEDSVVKLRTLPEEYVGHADPALAALTFPDLANKQAYSINNPFFFKYKGDGLPTGIKTRDITEFYSVFIQNKGDWKQTFNGIEFQVPAYLYDNEDILGNPRVTSRGVSNKDIKILVYVMSFSLIDYIENDPRVLTTLDGFDAREALITTKYKYNLELSRSLAHTYRWASIVLNAFIALVVVVIMHILKRR